MFSQDCQSQETRQEQIASRFVVGLSALTEPVLFPRCHLELGNLEPKRITVMKSLCFGHFASFHSAPRVSPFSWQAAVLHL